MNLIRVWTARPNSPRHDSWPRLAALLDEREREQAMAFRFDRHRQQYVAAHALKRLMLSSVAGGHPSSWDFEIDPGGKPRVADAPSLFFNISHCDGLVACAVCEGMELGLDVERVLPNPPVEVAEEWFAPSETQLLRCAESEQASVFFRLWTLKEAFIKNTGRGLAQPLHHFAFQLDPVRVSFHDSSLGDPECWRFEQQSVGADHLLALAWRNGQGEEAMPSVEGVELEALLSD